MQPGDPRTRLPGRKGCVRWGGFAGGGGARGRGSSQAVRPRGPPLGFTMTAFRVCVFLGSPPGLEGEVEGNPRTQGWGGAYTHRRRPEWGRLPSLPSEDSKCAPDSPREPEASLIIVGNQ